MVGGKLADKWLLVTLICKQLWVGEWLWIGCIDACVAIVVTGSLYEIVVGDYWGIVLVLSGRGKWRVVK